jgi:hypothetical protein
MLFLSLFVHWSDSGSSRLESRKSYAQIQFTVINSVTNQHAKTDAHECQKSLTRKSVKMTRLCVKFTRMRVGF